MGRTARLGRGGLPSTLLVGNENIGKRNRTEKETAVLFSTAGGNQKCWVEDRVMCVHEHNPPESGGGKGRSLVP